MGRAKGRYRVTNQDYEIEELRKKLYDFDNANKRQEVLEKVLNSEDIKTLPVDLVKKLITHDEAETMDNIELLRNSLQPKAASKVNNSVIADLQTRYDEAVQKGNTPLTVSLKNKIFELQSQV